MIKIIAIIIGAVVIGLASYLLLNEDKRKKQMEQEIRKEFVRNKYAEYLERRKGEKK